MGSFTAVTIRGGLITAVIGLLRTVKSSRAGLRWSRGSHGRERARDNLYLSLFFFFSTRTDVIQGRLVFTGLIMAVISPVKAKGSPQKESWPWSQA